MGYGSGGVLHSPKPADYDVMTLRISFGGITEEEYRAVGEFILLFSHLEWLIANVLRILSTPPSELTSFLRLETSQKFEKIKELGFDVNSLYAVRDFRHDLAHGILLDSEGKILRNLVKRRTADFDFDAISGHMEILKIEGGNLISFLKSKGYSLQK